MQNIKNIFKSVFKSPIICLFIIFCLFLLPGVIGQESASFASAISTGLGIDIEDGVFTTYLSYNAPSDNNDFSQNNKIVIGQGTGYSDSIEDISKKIGKEIRFAHTRVVVIGPEIAKTNLALTIDPLIRTLKLRNSCPIVYCKTPVKEFMDFAVQIKKNTGLTATSMICYDLNDATNKIESNLDNFYKGYLSKTKTSVMNCISMTTNEKEGVSNSSTSENGGGAQPSKSSPQSASSNDEKYLVNNGELAIFKNGALKEVLSYRDSVGACWIVGKYFPNTLTIKNITTKKLKNADITFNIIDKNVSRRATVIDGVPYFYANIDLSLQLEGIINNDAPMDIVNSEDVELDDEILLEMNKKIKKEFSDGLKKIREIGADIVGVMAEFSYDLDKIKGTDNEISAEELLEKTMFYIKVTATSD